MQGPVKEQGMKAVLKALILVTLTPGVAFSGECKSSAALGTSRTLTLQTGGRAGIGHGFAPLGLAHGEIILTFDDGPMPGTTPQILDILAKDCIEATFFMIGKRADAHPELAARVRDAGHSIGSHSYSHRELNRLPYQQAVDDIQRGYDAVERAAFGSIGDRPRLFRFPGFKSTPELIGFVRAHHGMVVDVNISPADWRGQPAEITLDRLKKLFDRQDRGIVILHDSQAQTVRLLPMVIAEMKARNMRIVHLAVE